MNRVRLPLPRTSTRAFFAARRTATGYSLVDFLHGYIYARWLYFYIGTATGERAIPRLLRPLVWAGKKWTNRTRRDAPPGPNPLSERYHGKVVPPELAEHLVTFQGGLELRGIEQIVPYSTARDLILQKPDHIVALDCPCRSEREHPCLPLDVCLIVGEPFASFIADHHPGRARWITQAEAVDVLRAEHERGHVHHAFFKDAMLGRFYAICNCCSCCCGAMQAFANGIPMLASSGYVARPIAARCVACGVCVAACPFGALSLDGESVAVDVERCMGCGVCVSKCPQETLSLVRDPAKPAPLDLRELARAESPS